MCAATTTFHLRNIKQNNYAGVPQSYVANGAYIQGLCYRVNDPPETFVLTQRGPDDYTISMGSYTVVPEAYPISHGSCIAQDDYPVREHSNIVLNDGDPLRQFTWRVRPKAKDKYPNAYGISVILGDHEVYWTLQYDRAGCNITLRNVLVDELLESQYWILEVAQFACQPNQEAHKE